MLYQNFEFEENPEFAPVTLIIYPAESSLAEAICSRVNWCKEIPLEQSFFFGFLLMFIIFGTKIAHEKMVERKGRKKELKNSNKS